MCGHAIYVTGESLSVEQRYSRTKNYHDDVEESRDIRERKTRNNAFMHFSSDTYFHGEIEIAFVNYKILILIIVWIYIVKFYIPSANVQKIRVACFLENENDELSFKNDWASKLEEIGSLKVMLTNSQKKVVDSQYYYFFKQLFLWFNLFRFAFINSLFFHGEFTCCFFDSLKWTKRNARYIWSGWWSIFTKVMFMASFTSNNNSKQI